MQKMVKPAVGEMLAAALELHSFGLSVIPLGDPWSNPPPHIRGETDQERIGQWCKRPRIAWKEFQTKAPTVEQIHDWWTKWPRANVAILTGGGLAIVDADSAEADAWLEESGAVTATSVKTRTSRGRHRWYRTSGNLAVTNAASASKIDIRGAGGYVVAPGSTYADGTRNQWDIPEGSSVYDALVNIAELTANDLAAIQRFGGHWGATDENGTPRGDPDLLLTAPAGTVPAGSALDDPLADLNIHLGAVKKPHDGSPVAPGGRNHALASMIGQWIKADWSLEKIIKKAHEWNERNPHPLPDVEVQACVISIHSTAKQKNGSLPPVIEQSGKMDVFNWDDLADKTPEIPQTFWQEGVVFRGSRILVAGPPKIGKSNFVIQMAMAAACGGTFLDQQFESPLKVLWLQAEIHKGFLHQRLNRLVADFSATEQMAIRKNFYMSGRCDLDLLNDSDFKQIDDKMASLKPDLVILDPVINFSSADENNNAEMRKMLRLVDSLGERHDCAMALVHHTRKDVSAGSFDAIRGASALRGWFDSGFLLTGKTGDAQIMLSYELRNAAGCKPQVLEQTDSGRFIPCDLELESTENQDGDESADPTIEGVMPRNAPRHNSTAAANHKSTASANRKSAPSANHKAAPVTTAESRNLSALEILKRSGSMSYSDLVEKVSRTLKVSERTAATLVSDLAGQGRIVRSSDGRKTVYQAA